jgi:hypothetical protein
MNLLLVEMQRALQRRVVRVLILLALIGCAVIGVIAFTSSVGKTLAQLQLNEQHHPAVMRDWWVAGTADGVLSIASFFLLLGGFFGGSSVAGAEWRAGTVTTVLTWEPRRVRLQLTRTAACAILAAGIAFALQVVFLASLLPATLANGSTANVDGAWWFSLFGAMARTSMLTSIAAVLGVALATLGRNTAFALVAVFTWLIAVEGVIRGLKPAFARFLWGENLGTILPWAQLGDSGFRRSPALALMSVLAYTAVFVVAATLTFQRRDVASTS